MMMMNSPRRLVVVLLLACAVGSTEAFQGTTPIRSLPTTTTTTTFGSDRITKLTEVLSSSSPRSWTTTTSLSQASTTSPLDDSSSSLSQQQQPSTPPPSSLPVLWEPLGAGVRRDMTARLRWSRSDFFDALNGQAGAAVCFLLFACLAPAIGFGGLYATATAGRMGPMEALVSTAGSGVLYAMTAAQPAAILGTTGPLLAFTAALAGVASRLGLPFLPLYGWTGLWLAGFLGLISLTSASNAVQRWTPFTDEIFSTLVSLIFITKAVGNLAQAVTGAPTLLPGLVTLGLALTTFGVTTALKRARHATSFGTKAVRTAVSNFAPTFGVAAACALAHWATTRRGVILSTLALPQQHFGTTSGRPWLVPLLDLPVWARWAAALPAAMGTVVLFFEHAITHRLINAPRFHMKKGRSETVRATDGMHADAGVLALLTAVQSVLGLPWLTAATVRSLAHVQALQTYDPQTGQPNGALEQRVTNVAIHTVLGALVVMNAPRQWLTRAVPPAALMGLFFYMGLSTLTSGNALWSRLMSLLRPKDNKEATTATTTADKVPRRLMKRLCAIQVSCVGALFWLSRHKTLGVLFPLVLALLPPLRSALTASSIIPEDEMKALESEN